MGLMDIGSNNPYAIINPFAAVIDQGMKGWRTTSDRIAAEQKDVAAQAQQAQILEFAKQDAKRKQDQYDLENTARESLSRLLMGSASPSGFQQGPTEPMQAPMNGLMSAQGSMNQFVYPSLAAMQGPKEAPVPQPVAKMGTVTPVTANDLWQEAARYSGTEAGKTASSLAASMVKEGPTAKDILEALKSGKIDPSSLASAKNPDGSWDLSKLSIFDDKAKEPKAITKPYLSNLGGKALLLQDYSDGTTKMVAQDASTTNKLHVTTNASTADQVSSDAQAILRGELAPSSLSKRNGHDVKVREEVRKMNSSFDFNKADANAKYMKNDTMNRQFVNLEGVKQPIAELESLGAKLQNSNILPFNKVAMAVRLATGNTDVVAYNAKRNSVIQELANAMRGAGISEGSIKLELDNFNNAYSPAQIKAATQNTLQVIQAKQNAIRQNPYSQNNNQPVSVNPASKPFKFVNGKWVQ